MDKNTLQVFTSSLFLYIIAITNYTRSDRDEKQNKYSINNGGEKRLALHWRYYEYNLRISKTTCCRAISGMGVIRSEACKEKWT
ncbi:hypothetical protein GCM10026983_03740 [Gracilibacillus alcaliphilus]